MIGTGSAVWNLVDTGLATAAWQVDSVAPVGLVLLSVSLPVLTAFLVWRAEHLEHRPAR